MKSTQKSFASVTRSCGFGFSLYLMGNLIYKWNAYFASILFVAKAVYCWQQNALPPAERTVKTCSFEMALYRWNRKTPCTTLYLFIFLYCSCLLNARMVENLSCSPYWKQASLFTTSFFTHYINTQLQKSQNWLFAHSIANVQKFYLFY